MRSPDVQQLGMFSYVSVEDRVPPDHPIRKLRILVDAILGELDELLAARYAAGGRLSIPPERILRASLLQAVYSVRSERLLMEQLNYNLLFRWFAGLNIDDPVWDHSTFSFNRQRLFDEAIAQHFFEHTVLLARLRNLVSDEHLSVDGTLLEAWASHIELPAQGRSRRGRWRQFPRSAAQQRDARVHHGSGCPADPQGPRQGGEAELPGQQPDGEPSWSGGRRGRPPCQWHRRAGRRLGSAHRGGRQARSHPGCRQGL